MLTEVFKIVGQPYQQKVRVPSARRKPRKSITNKVHEQWFFSLDPKYFITLADEWNELNLKIKLEKHDNYDDWLNYFKTIPARQLNMLANTGQDILDTEAFTALLRWRDIVLNPHRIDKIHQSGLTNKGKDEKQKSIVDLAQNNDRLGVLRATRDRIAEKLEKGAGARDTAALAREMTEIMTQIADYEKRMGPKKTTLLGQLLDDMPNNKPKRAKDKGARNTSFKSRVTIEDVEK